MYTHSNIMESPLLNKRSIYAVRDVYVDSKISMNEPLMIKKFLYSVWFNNGSGFYIVSRLGINNAVFVKYMCSK